jgi:Zn-dependent M28 family amino/carboxypeptidase
VNSEELLSGRLRTTVDRLAGLIGPRHVAKPGSLEAAAALIEREFGAMGDGVERQTYRVETGRTRELQDVSNLIVERRGKRRPDEIVILGAHYDTVPATPGADDNASAVAVMLEVARLLRANDGAADRAVDRTVRFVAFACEEPPHFCSDEMGSVVYARECRRRGERIVGMLCLEMVGYYTDRSARQQLPPELPRFLRPFFPRRGNFLAAVGNMASWRLCWSFRRGFKHAVRFPLFSIVLPERVTSIRLSDNASFWDYGYPALMLTDTSFLRNPHYHQPSDTPATLDYHRMAQVTRGVAGAVARIAGR